MNSIERIYTLEDKKDYRPGNGVIEGKHPSIKAIHCIHQPQQEIVFKTMNNQRVSLPPDAFVPGAIYPYQIVLINAEGARCFVGLSY